ncbi:hypothetical protein BDZ89DRAFT_1071717 [Hymenopellis radicata]|nr:hypothetical protein BDZ89DRAFT_1071717 [Hymenopellis radicata]
MTAYYSDELKKLDRCLKALPQSIPANDAYQFMDYEPNQEDIDDYGSAQGVVNKHLEPQFGDRDHGPIKFKGRGPALEAVVPILRRYLTGKSGENLLLIKWVDDLTAAAILAIEKDGGTVPRETATTAAKRLFDDATTTRDRNKRHKATKATAADARRAAQKVTEQGDVGVPLENLTDDEEILPSDEAPRKTGRKPSELLNSCTIRCRVRKDGTRRWRCSGDGCRTNWADPRMSSRVLSHASLCKFHTATVRQAALQASSEKSLGAQVKADDIPPPTEKRDFFAGFRAAGAVKEKTELQKFQTRANLYTLQLICDACLPVAVVDNPMFRQLVNHLNSSNGIFVGSTFSNNYIPHEAAHVTILAFDYLGTQFFLSITYDGGSLRKPQSVYTVHVTVTTPYGREAYFVHGDEASGVSHTGEHIRDVLLKIIYRIGPERFGSIGSDSTGNTSSAREYINSEIPTINRSPRPMPSLLEYFQEPIVRMKGTIRYFSKSNYGSTHMRALRVTLEINKGLEKVGKTRFGTIYWAGYALQRCLPAITELLNSNVILTDTDSPLAFLKNLPLSQAFNLRLTQLVCVLEPIARAIKCLEGLDTTVGDVWKFYVAITAVIRDLFVNNAQGYPPELQEAIRKIINSRYKEMIGGERGVVYLAGFYLDPEQLSSPILRKSQANVLERGIVRLRGPPSDRTDQDLRDAMPTYAKVGLFLIQTLYHEMNSRGRDIPACSQYETSTAAVAALKSQFEAYTRQHAPFSARVHARTPLEYWRTMSESPHADVLAFIAIKIFSLLPNSMPEERTVSSFTRMNTVDRASQKAESVVGMTKIRQHNRRVDRMSKQTSLPSPPTLNWRSVGTLFASAKSAKDAPETPPSNSTAPIPARPEETDDQPLPKGDPPNLTIDAQEGLDALDGNMDEEDNPCPVVSDNTKSFDIEGSDNGGEGIDLSLPYFRDLLSEAPIVPQGGSATSGAAKTTAAKAFAVVEDIMDLEF